MNWHARLGHIRQDILERLYTEGLLVPLANIDMQKCESFLSGKATNKSFGKETRAENPLQLIHFDICGPKNVKERHNALHILLHLLNFLIVLSMSI